MTNSQNLYDPLPDFPPATRLVRVERLDKEGLLSLITHDVNLDDDYTYLALSYVWGVDAPSYRILVNGQAFWIRHNLWSFFITHYKKLTQDTWLWIDSVCINQDDIPEKNRQVPLMGQIYAGAKVVISWLNDPSPPLTLTKELNTDASGRLVTLINSDTYESTRHDSVQGGADIETIAGALRRLLCHEYWSRVWIVQEVQLAQDVEIYWGRHRISGGKLFDFVTSLAENQYLNSALHRLNSDQIEKRVQTLRKLGRDYMPNDTQQASLLDLVLQTLDLSCSIVHDHVYGLLSLARNGHRFKPDYTESSSNLLMRLLYDEEKIPPKTEVEKLSNALGLNLSGLPLKIVARWKLQFQSESWEIVRQKWSLALEHEDWAAFDTLELCTFCCPLRHFYHGGNPSYEGQHRSMLDDGAVEKGWYHHGLIVGFPAIDFYVGISLDLGQTLDSTTELTHLRFAFAFAPGCYAKKRPGTTIHADSLLSLLPKETPGMLEQDSFDRCVSMHFKFDRETMSVRSDGRPDEVYDLIGILKKRDRVEDIPGKFHRSIWSIRRYLCSEVASNALIYDPNKPDEFREKWNVTEAAFVLSETGVWGIDRRYFSSANELLDSLNAAWAIAILERQREG